MNQMIVKSARALTHEEYLACSRLTFRSEGLLFHWLKEIRKEKPTEYNLKNDLWDIKMPFRPSDASVVMYKEDGKIVGWGMVLENGRCGFYVKSDHRRRGIGSKMVSRAKKINPNLIVSKHDDRSVDFFDSNGL